MKMLGWSSGKDSAWMVHVLRRVTMSTLAACSPPSMSLPNVWRCTPFV